MCIASTVNEVRNQFARIRASKNRLARETYQWCKEHGICTHCHSEPAMPGKVYCWQCKMSEKDRKRMEYDRRKEHGLCVYCGKRKSLAGIVCCHECNEKMKLKKQTSYEERKSRGECTNCGRKLPQDTMFLMCERCRAKERERKQAA